jgi:hypothetical protein
MWHSIYIYTNNAPPNFFSAKTSFPVILVAQHTPPSGCRTANFRTPTRGIPISVLSALGNRGLYRGVTAGGYKLHKNNGQKAPS